MSPLVSLLLGEAIEALGFGFGSVHRGERWVTQHHFARADRLFQAANYVAELEARLQALEFRAVRGSLDS